MKRFKNILLFLLLFSPMVSVIHASRKRASDYISKGWKLSDSNPVQTEKFLLKAIHEDPKWDYPHLLLADLYDKNYVVNNAIQSYLTVINLGISQPSFKFKIYSRLGILNLMLGHLKSAKNFLQKAQKLKRNASEIRTALHQISLIEKASDLLISDPSQAESLLTNALSQKKDLFIAYKLLAKMKESQGKNQDAQKLYEQILSFSPVKNVVLSSDLSFKNTNPYYFVRDLKDSSHWTLTVQFPAGHYKYYFVQNFGYPSQKVFLDPKNKKRTAKGNKIILNVLELTNSFKPYTFEFKTLKQDPLFYESEKAIAHLFHHKEEKKRHRLYGEKSAGEAIDFKFFYPRAYSVAIVGNFNHWGKEMLPSGIEVFSYKYIWPMKKSEKTGFWTLSAKLSLSTASYAYLINGKTLIKDPNIHKKALSKISNINELVWSKYSFLVAGDLIEQEFSFYAPKAKNVWLVGDFNNWGGTKDGKKLSTIYAYVMDGPDNFGNWHYTANLPRAAYGYKFVINKTKWIIDPKADFYTGKRENRNSIIFVGRKIFPEGWFEGMTQPWSTSRHVHFVYNPKLYKKRKTKIRSVSVLGEFNKWGGRSIFKHSVPGYFYPMKEQTNGTWSFDAWIAAGEYQYGFSINGSRRLYPDLKAEKFVKINSRKSNSVLILPLTNGGKFEQE